MSILDDNFARDLAKKDGWFIPSSAISDSAAASLDELIARAKHGGTADLKLRVDAVETMWQADWIKYMRHIHPRSGA